MGGSWEWLIRSIKNAMETIIWKTWLRETYITHLLFTETSSDGLDCICNLCNVIIKDKNVHYVRLDHVKFLMND